MQCHWTKLERNNTIAVSMQAYTTCRCRYVAIHNKRLANIVIDMFIMEGILSSV